MPLIFSGVVMVLNCQEMTSASTTKPPIQADLGAMMANDASMPKILRAVIWESNDGLVEQPVPDQLYLAHGRLAIDDEGNASATVFMFKSLTSKPDHIETIPPLVIIGTGLISLKDVTNNSMTMSGVSYCALAKRNLAVDINAAYMEAPNAKFIECAAVNNEFFFSGVAKDVGKTIRVAQTRFSFLSKATKTATAVQNQGTAAGRKFWQKWKSPEALQIEQDDAQSTDKPVTHGAAEGEEIEANSPVADLQSPAKKTRKLKLMA